MAEEIIATAPRQIWRGVFNYIFIMNNGKLNRLTKKSRFFCIKIFLNKKSLSYDHIMRYGFHIIRYGF